MKSYGQFISDYVRHEILELRILQACEHFPCEENSLTESCCFAVMWAQHKQRIYTRIIPTKRIVVFNKDVAQTLFIITRILTTRATERNAIVVLILGTL